MRQKQYNMKLFLYFHSWPSAKKLCSLNKAFFLSFFLFFFFHFFTLKLSLQVAFSFESPSNLPTQFLIILGEVEGNTTPKACDFYMKPFFPTINPRKLQAQIEQPTKKLTQKRRGKQKN